MRPIAVAATPPMTSQMDLSVGEPVKNLETSEPNEFVALIPMIRSTMPPASRARERALFTVGSNRWLFWIKADHQIALRPEMRLTRIMTTAITRRTWMNPPIVALVTIPRAHRTINTIAIVYNIIFFFQFALVTATGALSRQS